MCNQDMTILKLGAVLLIIITVTIVSIVFSRMRPAETFVAYNDDSPFNSLDSPWFLRSQEIATFLGGIGNLKFALSPQVIQQQSFLQDLLNQLAKNKFNFQILSVDSMEGNTWKNIVIIDTISGTSFIINSATFVIQNGLIQQIILDLPTDSRLNWSSFNPLDTLFRIANPLHLFSPYWTSTNDMVITDEDVSTFNKVAQLKDAELQKLEKSMV